MDAAEDHVQVDVVQTDNPVSSPSSKAQKAIDKIGIAPGFPTKCLAILVASVWVIASATYIWRNNGYQAYAVAVGSVSLVASLGALVMLKINPDAMSDELFRVRDEPVTAQQILACYLVLWWLVGTGICTFINPFTITSNGYFGMWGGLIASILALADCYEAVRQRVNNNFDTATDASASFQSVSACLFAACLVVLLACCSVLNGQAGEAIFGIVASAITMVIAVVFIFAKDLEEKQETLLNAFVAILLVLWVVAAGVLTFRVFISTGNGFFGSYAALFFTFKLVGIRFLN